MVEEESALPLMPSDAHLRRRYTALLRGEAVIDERNNVIDTDYERWRELKRMVIVYGLPRDESASNSERYHKKESEASANAADAPTAAIDGSAGEPEAQSPHTEDPDATTSDTGNEEAVQPPSTTGEENKGERSDATPMCSLRGRIWKVFLGVDRAVDTKLYAELVDRGASYCDGDIRNDTFRTFRGDPAFAQRVPEEKLARVLNVFINELGTNSTTSNSESRAYNDHPEDIRYVQGMNILCAPLLYVMPEADAYYTFCQLIVKHCPHYMAPKLKGVVSGCLLVDKCLQTVRLVCLDADLFNHLKSRGINAQIYALPLILSLFACAPPLHELLRVWDVLFHRLPDELIYEIARHPFEHPDSASSLPLSTETIAIVMNQIRRQHQQHEQQHQAQGISSAATTAAA